MPSTFLDLCQQLVEEAGISGEITSVVNQTGELKRVVNWVIRATTAIEGKWFNWDFLHSFHTFTTIIGVSDYPVPSDFNLWDVYTCKIPSINQEINYEQWTRKKKDVSSLVSGDPYLFTVLPDKAIRLFDTPTKILTISIEYWKTPTVLTVNTSQPLIPLHFRDIIVAKALQYYANYNSAEEAKIEAIEEYDLRLIQLEAREAPGQQGSGSVTTGVDIQVRVPYEDSQGSDDGYFQ